MKNRLTSVAGAASVAVVCLAGCSEQPRVASEQSARVTIGNSTNAAQSVDCSQWQWFWTIDVGDETHGAEAVFRLSGTKATAKWVKFHDFDGFTGSFWEGGVGHATATVTGNTYTVAGDAYGYGPKDPNKPGTESFRIVAYC